MLAFSDQLLDANRDVWDRMQAHRFVADIERDMLDPQVFHRYLVYEHAFVETAILIFGHAMLKAPDFQRRRWLIGVLHALAEEQIPYFERSFRALGIEPARYSPHPPEVAAFAEGMLHIAERGSYADAIMAMLAAEWLYGTWCSRAAKREIHDPALREWVRLHAEAGFMAQVAWLRREADAAGAASSAHERERLAGIFRRAIELEIAFHHAPFEPITEA